MMMPDDKKKRATLIIAKMKGGSPDMPKEAPKSDDGAEMDSSMGYMAAAEEMMKAIESKDPKMLMSAVKAFVDMCMDESPEDESEYESDAE